MKKNHHARGALALGLLALAGCDDEGGSGGSIVEDQPRYAVVSLVFDTEGSTSYVSLLDALDARPKVTLASAQEFAGYAPADAIGGQVYVGSGDSPVLTRYRVGDDGVWHEQASLSFGAYTSLPVEMSSYVSDQKAYAPVDTTDHVIWDPSTLTILGRVGAPAQIPLMRGELQAYRGYSHELSGGRVYQPYYWSDPTFHHYTQISQVSVIDTATDAVSAVVDAPCPHLHITTQDEDGDVFLSNGQGSIAAAVLDAEHPRNCMVRIPAGSTALDEAFTVDFRDLAGGREGSNFFYVGDGKGFFNVFHAERQTIDENTAYAEVDYSSNYHLWTLDLDTMEAAIMPGIDFAGGQFIAAKIDGRTILAIPAPDYSSTAVYEIGAEGATKLFDVEGWAFKLFRVR